MPWGGIEFKERRAHKRWRDARRSRDARCRGRAKQGRRARDVARATCAPCACPPAEAQREVASARRRSARCGRARSAAAFVPSSRGSRGARRQLACELGGEAGDDDIDIDDIDIDDIDIDDVDIDDVDVSTIESLRT